MDTDDLLIQRRDGVVEVTFNRPERRNAFTSAMYAAMRELCDELADDTSVRVLVLRSGSWLLFSDNQNATERQTTRRQRQTLVRDTSGHRFATGAQQPGG
ncbi:MAG: hypothetical protein EOO67_20355 [Microbacterium sp.]|nr:MAG: hypothetical protein EOO67_20355 [Microbacterium sp.]